MCLDLASFAKRVHFVLPLWLVFGMFNPKGMVHICFFNSLLIKCYGLWHLTMLRGGVATHTHDKKGNQSSKHNCNHFSTKQHMCPPIVVLAVHGSSLFALRLFEPKL